MDGPHGCGRGAAAAALTALVLFLRTRSPLSVVGGVVVVAACYPFLKYHVFPPRGVFAMVAIGLGLALFEAARRPTRGRG